MSPRTMLSDVFERSTAAQRAAFIPFFVAGDPNYEVSRDCICAAAQSGADIIEIGIPYSDPLADGPTIQRAAQRARNGGMTFDRALRLTADCLQRFPNMAFIGFTYYNPVFVRGIERTAADFAAAGMRGIIVPDLPFGESQPLREAFERYGLSVTFLIAPTTQLQRAAQIAAYCSDFVYVVSRMGITGADTSVGESLAKRLLELRMITPKPLAVGFGIDSPETARAVARYADGAIVGSALLDRMEAASSGEEAVAWVRGLCSQLSAACRRGAPIVAAKG